MSLENEINISVQACENFRTACSERQRILAKLTEEAITHTAQLSNLKGQLIEKHQETLIKMFTERLSKQEKDITDLFDKLENTAKELHGKINNIFITVLIGAIIYLVGAIALANNFSSDLSANKTLIDTHINDCVQTKKNLDKIFVDHSEFKNHVSNAAILINKYDKYGDEIEELEKRMNKVELEDARYHSKR